MNKKNNINSINSTHTIGLFKRRNMRIGLLGGTFDPPHKGHLYISDLAIKLFKLHEVWWIITPQNPLKYSTSTHISIRTQNSHKILHRKKIRAESLEIRYHTNYTFHTLEKLTKYQPGNKFIWIIGADNLAQIHKWYNWNKIFKTLPIAVFDRPGYSKAVISSVAAKYYNKSLLNRQNVSKIFKKKLPVWVFLRIRTMPDSSTKIRLYKKR